MMILVSGGSGSGKSAFAESLIVQSGSDCRIYLATMHIRDAESRMRVERHRAMRADKGFRTLEVPEDLAAAEIPPGSAVLLEDLPNLVANELFGEHGPDGVCERILAGIRNADSRADLMVIVTGELVSDGSEYAPETGNYLRILAELHRTLAAEAGMVFEVVCGIPICHKGEKL